MILNSLLININFKYLIQNMDLEPSHNTERKTKVQALALQKKNIEHELIQILDYLKDCGAGLTGNLVDSEGYPRADIDIISIRTMRNRRACLQTDLNTVMAEIEKELHAIHAEFTQHELDNPPVNIKLEQVSQQSE